MMMTCVIFQSILNPPESDIMSGKSYLLPDQVYGDEEMMHFSISDDAESEISAIDNYAQEMNKLLKSLEIWDDVDLLDNSHEVIDNWPDKCHRFLADNNIRPEFFCQYEKIFSVSSTKKKRRKRHQPLLKGRTVAMNFSHDLDLERR